MLSSLGQSKEFCGIRRTVMMEIEISVSQNDNLLLLFDINNLLFVKLK